jgi:hypothetical protein
MRLFPERNLGPMRSVRLSPGTRWLKVKDRQHHAFERVKEAFS